MMESATGMVSTIDGFWATVIVDAPVACQRCASGKGCGAGLFLQGAANSRQIRMRLPAGAAIKVGDEVALSIAPAYLLRAAFLAYALPLIAVLLALAAGLLLTDTLADGVALLLALGGLFAGLTVSRALLANRALCEQFVPQCSRHDGAHE